MKTSKEKSSHRRKVRGALPPAHVSVDAAGAVWVVVPDIVAKNETMRRAGKGQHLSAAVVRYRSSVTRGVAALGEKGLFQGHTAYGGFRPIESGRWRLDVLGVWPTRYNLAGLNIDDGGPDIPVGDVDAGISQAQDALQKAGILDDDKRIDPAACAWKMYRKGVRATVMRLAPSAAPPATLAEMVAMLDAHLPTTAEAPAP